MKGPVAGPSPSRPPAAPLQDGRPALMASPGPTSMASPWGSYDYHIHVEAGPREGERLPQRHTEQREPGYNRGHPTPSCGETPPQTHRPRCFLGPTGPRPLCLNCPRNPGAEGGPAGGELGAEAAGSKGPREWRLQEQREGLEGAEAVGNGGRRERRPLRLPAPGNSHEEERSRVSGRSFLLLPSGTAATAQSCVRGLH